MSDRTPSENRNARRVESLPRDFAVEARNWLWRHVSNDNVQIEQFIFPLSSLMSDVHNRAQQMGQGSALKETSGHQSTTSDVARAQPGAPDGVDGPGNLSKEKPADPRQPCPTCKLPRLMPRPEVPPFSQRQAPHVIAEARRRAGLPPFSVTDEVFGLALLDILTERGSGGHINGPLVPAPVQDTTEKPLPGAELAEKHGFKPHGKDPLTGHVLPPSDPLTRAVQSRAIYGQVADDEREAAIAEMGRRLEKEGVCINSSSSVSPSSGSSSVASSSSDSTREPATVAPRDEKWWLLRMADARAVGYREACGDCYDACGTCVAGCGCRARIAELRVTEPRMADPKDEDPRVAKMKAAAAEHAKAIAETATTVIEQLTRGETAAAVMALTAIRMSALMIQEAWTPQGKDGEK